MPEVLGRYVTVTVDGVDYRVYYESAGSGIPVLLQHTAGADGREWRHLLDDDELTSRFRFIAHDLPYHGKSLPPTGVEWWSRPYELHHDFFGDFVIELARTLGLTDAVYMGCSMGGHLAPELALDHPGFFRAVIALEGGLLIDDEDPYVPYMWHPRISDELKPSLMYTMMSPSSPEAYRREVTWLYGQGAPGVHQGDLVYYYSEHDMADTAKDVDTSRTAVYVMSGDYDWSATPDRCRALADAIDGAHYICMPGLGHFPMSEDPEAFRRYLVPVLDEIEAGKTSAG